MTLDTPLDFALAYAAAGFRVIPVTGKIPLVEHGAHDSSAHEATLRQWWQRWPAANIGLNLDGLVAVDVDPRNGGAVDALRRPLPDTCYAKTGGGGFHYLFRSRNGTRYPGKLAPGIDLKHGAGSYICVEPSVHASGQKYVWLDETEPWTTTPAEAPEWLALQPGQRANDEAPAGAILEGGRNAHLASLAGSMRRRGMSVEAILSALLVENSMRCSPPLGDDEVKMIAASVGRYAPAPDLKAKVAALDTTALARLTDNSKHGAKSKPAVRSAPSSTVQVGGAELLDAVHAFLGRFVAYPSMHAHVAHVLWIAHTHLMDAWDSTPRIAFLSPEPGSGKSRALEVSELLVPRPVESVNVTPAYLFRKVGAEEGRPTILYDEIDTVFGPKAKDNEEIRGLLNAGHRKHSTAGRCVVRGKQVFTEEIPAYCAVALAGLGGLPDTMLTRSVVVRMRRRAPSEMVEPYRRREQCQAGEALSKRLEMWAASVESKVTGVWPVMPHGIHDRDADVWEALLACADAADGTWPEAARVACVALVAESKASTPSLGIHLLSDLRKVFGDAEALSTEQILTKLIALDESPWGDLRGKPLDARGLSNRLRPYGVSPTSVRIGDSTPKGYYRQSFWDSWNRYLGPPPLESATTATSATEAPDVSDVADVAASRWEAPTDQTDNKTPLDDNPYYRATRGE